MSDYQLVNKSVKMMSTQINFKPSPQGTIYYSVVEKESQTGVSYNWRLLVVLEQNYVGYISKPNMKDPSQSVDLKNMKTKIPFTELVKIKAKEGSQNLKWQFRMKNQAMCLAWEDMLQKQVAPGPSRSPTKYVQKAPSQPNIVYPIPINKEESPIKSQLKNQDSNKIIQQSTKTGGKFIENQPKQQKQQFRVNNVEFSLEGKNDISFSHDKNFQQLKDSQQRKQIQEMFQKESSVKGHSEKMNSQAAQENLIMSQTKPVDLKQVLIQDMDQLQNRKISVSRSEPKLRIDQIFKIQTPPLPEYIKQQKLYQHPPMTQISSDKPKNLFLNYFRKEPNQIDNSQYQTFLKYAQSQVIKLLKGQLKLSQQENSPTKVSSSQPIKSIFSKKNFTESAITQGRQNPLFFSLSDLTITLPLTELKQVPINLQHKGSTQYSSHKICDESLLKEQLQQMKNHDYIWECLLRDQSGLKDLFLLPVCCVIEYAGWTAVVKSRINPATIEQVQKSQIDSSILFDRLAQITGISRDIFEDQLAIEFVPTEDDRFILTSARSYLPRLGEINIILRPQLYMKIKSDGPYPYSSSLKEKEVYHKNYKIRLQQEIGRLAKRLQKMQKYFMHPVEVSATFHQEGINIKQLGSVCKKVTTSLTRKHLKSQIASRVTKIIFRKKMQQEIQKVKQVTGQTKGFNTTVLSQEKVIKRFLNLILGGSQDSRLLWKVLTLHSQILFGVSVQPQDLHKGYFLLGLEHQLGFSAKAKYSVDSIFKKNDFLQRIQLYAKVKSCRQRYVPIDIKVNQKLQKVNLFDLVAQSEVPFQQYAEFIVDYFNFRDLKLGKLSSSIPKSKAHKVKLKSPKEQLNRKFPLYFTWSQKELVMNYLANFVPLQMDSPTSQTDSIGLYDVNRPLTVGCCRRQLIATKWTIKKKQQAVNGEWQGDDDSPYGRDVSSEVIFKELEQLYKKLTVVHRCDQQTEAFPFLSQMHDLISMYYLSNREYHHAIHHGRLSLTNLMQVCGSNMHVKIANSYYQLSQCYLNCINKLTEKEAKESPSSFQLLSPPSIRPFSPLQQALNCLKKSKNILETNLMTQTSQYALIQAQIGKICLLMQRDAESYKLLSNALRIMEQCLQETDIADMVECYQLLLRSNFNNSEKFIQISRKLMLWVANSILMSEQSQGIKGQAQEFNQSLTDQILQKVLKMTIEGQIINIMQMCFREGTYVLLSDYFIELSITEQTLNRPTALDNIRLKLQQGTFVNQTAKYFQEFETYLDKINKNRMKLQKDHDSKQFESYMKNIVGALGDGYLGQAMLNYVHLNTK